MDSGASSESTGNKRKNKAAGANLQAVTGRTIAYIACHVCAICFYVYFPMLIQ